MCFYSVCAHITKNMERIDRIMSASREKKQRQGAELSPKEIKAREEEARRQRNTKIYIAIGAVVVVLVAALLIWNTGIFQRGATAATVGEIPVRMPSAKQT